MTRLVASITFGAWAAAVLSVGVALTVLHGAVLPAPTARHVQSTGQVTLLHVVDEECRCSGRLMDYLAARGRAPDLSERVLLAHATPERRAALEARGFAVEALDEDELQERFGALSVPSLIIAQADGAVVYAGAHRPRPTMDPVDLDLAARVRRGETPESLAINGCAVSHALARRLDPLGLKYGFEK